MAPSHDDVCAYRFPARGFSPCRHTDVLEDIPAIPDEVDAGNLDDSIVGRKNRKSQVCCRPDRLVLLSGTHLHVHLIPSS